jgi:hypothetical protein
LSKHFHFTTANDEAGADGPATLCGINVNAGAASAVVTVYNNTSAAAPTVAVIDASVEGSYDFHYLRLSNLWVKLTAGNADVTVLYE